MSKIRGLFVNSEKANCSIYEAGVAIKEALGTNDRFQLDYAEFNSRIPIPRGYDFYLINWHHIVLPYNRAIIQGLRGLKIAIVLEVGPVNPLPLIPADLFDVYMVIDPTKERKGNIYPFPRPLEKMVEKKELLDKFSIGSFGLLTPGKKFEEIIMNANIIGDCIVRMNFPPVTWLNERTVTKRLLDYADFLRKFAEPQVDLRITHNYMTKQELMSWCSQHHLNSFPYYRNMDGLAAVTDQAISAGRGLAVTDCNTFRHIHKYISCYPYQNYEELAESTVGGVLKMQEDWSQENFLRTFINMLGERGL
jgi:hypothetical protein